jgi:hypothetical protein
MECWVNGGPTGGQTIQMLWQTGYSLAYGGVLFTVGSGLFSLPANTWVKVLEILNLRCAFGCGLNFFYRLPFFKLQI